MRLLAPAKINLHLRVAPPDGSGFHSLLSWMCTVSLFDTLSIDRADTTSIHLTSDDPGLACDDSNLVIRAAKSTLNELAPGQRGLDIHLQKRIPSGGGLGGGSSDAARTLLGLNALWKLDWPIQRLARLSAALGSDVPFFLFGPSSLCTGRGQMVQPVSRPRPKWAVLFLPALALPTPAVYRKFDEMKLGHSDALTLPPDWSSWTQESAKPLLGRLVNDLEAPALALAPELRSLRQDLEREFGRAVRMSGSGSSLFTLFDESDEAKSAVARMKERPGVRVLTTELAPVIEDDLAVP